MLDDFLETMAATPFVDGTADCALTMADWAMVATGCPDPAAHLRGRYRTPFGRERLLQRRGGLANVMADCAARAGLSETTTPVRGDIGLIRWGRRPYAAIFLGQRWVVKSSEGVTVRAADVVIRAWRVPHG